MKGRRPGPPELTIHAGHPERRRTPPQPRAGRVSPPKWLAGEALACWKRQAPDLIRQGVLTAADRELFAAYCVSWASYVEATALLAKEGATYRSVKPAEEGKEETVLVKRHPAVTVQAEAVRQLRLIGERFGLDPLGRQRLDVEPPRAADPEKERFFRGST